MSEKLRHPNPNYPDRELAPEDRPRMDVDLIDRLRTAYRKARDGDITYDALAALCADAADALAFPPEPVAWRYRWKLDGAWTNWRVADHSQKSRHLRDLEEHPLYTARDG